MLLIIFESSRSDHKIKILTNINLVTLDRIELKYISPSQMGNDQLPRDRWTKFYQSEVHTMVILNDQNLYLCMLNVQYINLIPI